MKLGQAIDAGYRIVKVDGRTVHDQNINKEYGTVTCAINDKLVNPFAGSSNTPQVQYIALSLDRDVNSLNIKLRMFVDYNEETAQALLIGEVAPLMKEDIATYKPKTNKAGKTMANAAYGSTMAEEISKLVSGC